MNREVRPELLDELPAEDPRAIQSRRDLRRVNAWMGHAGIIRRALAGVFRDRPPQSIVELGAGDGTFLLRLARRTASRWKPARVLLVDRQQLLSAETRAEFKALSWNVEAVQMDVAEWLRGSAEPSDLTIANLFLHHFKDDDLRGLLRQVAEQTSCFLACEPRRSRVALAATRLLSLIGCNEVTRHDGRISVQAGFTDNELSSMWPTDKGWRLTEGRAGWVSHCFLARARPVTATVTAAARR